TQDRVNSVLTARRLSMEQLRDQMGKGDVDAGLREAFQTYERDIEKFREHVRGLLDSTEKTCREIDLTYTVAYIGRVRPRLETIRQLGEFADLYKQLGERIEDQLKDRTFFFVPPGRAAYLADAPPPFGDTVRSAFPEVMGDILDASRCLGFGLPTG